MVNLGVASYVESVLLYTLTAVFTLAHIHYGVRVVSLLEQNGFYLVLVSHRKVVKEKFQKKVAYESSWKNWDIPYKFWIISRYIILDIISLMNMLQ